MRLQDNNTMKWEMQEQGQNVKCKTTTEQSEHHSGYDNN